jgi:hypothetical protein
MEFMKKSEQVIVAYATYIDPINSKIWPHAAKRLARWFQQGTLD